MSSINIGISEENRRAIADGLSRLLGEEPIIDLLHCDIQGAEGETLSASMATLNARVRRVPYRLPGSVDIRLGCACQAGDGAVLDHLGYLADGLRVTL